MNSTVLNKLMVGILSNIKRSYQNIKNIEFNKDQLKSLQQMIRIRIGENEIMEKLNKTSVSRMITGNGM